MSRTGYILKSTSSTRHYFQSALRGDVLYVEDRDYAWFTEDLAVAMSMRADLGADDFEVVQYTVPSPSVKWSSILLIEDDKTVARATKRMIERSVRNGECLVVDSVADAISALRAFHFDVVVSDFDIIGGTGADVLDWIRTNQPRLLSSFMFCSGNDDAKLFGVPCIEKGLGISEINVFRTTLQRMAREVVS